MRQAVAFRQSPSSVSAVCATRMELLDKLASMIQALGKAKVELQDGDALNFESAQFDVQELRSECSSLRRELESHRAQHGC